MRYNVEVIKTSRDFAAPELGEGQILRVYPESRALAVHDKLDRLTRRAEKLGVEAPSLVVIGHETREYKSNEGGRWAERFEAAVLTLRPVRLSGWAFEGTIQHTSEGNIIRSVPGAEIPREYRTASASWCDHCQTERRRTDTFVVRHEDGRVLRVGRSCVADFVGSVDGAKIADYYAEAGSLGDYDDDGGYGAGGGFEGYPLELFVAQCKAVARERGWVSRAVARDSDEDSTASFAQMVIRAWARPSPSNAWLRDPKYAPSEADFSFAREAIAWGQGIAEDTSSDYLWNLRIIAGQDWIGTRLIGLAASFVVAYGRILEEKAAEKGPKAPIVHYPAPIGAKLGRKAKKGETAYPAVPVVVTAVRHFEGQYGVTSLIRMEAEGPSGERYVFIWRASGSFEIPAGSRRLLIGTVKGHSEYKGTKQTDMTRCELAET